MTTDIISKDLKTVLRSLKLSPMLDTLPERLALARQQKWGEARAAIARAQALDPKAPVDAELVAFLEKAAVGAR